MSALREVEPNAWDSLLDGLGAGDAYLRRGSVAAAALLEAAAPVFLALDDRALFAALVREIPGSGGLYDVSTPYPYGGPVARRGEPADDFWAAYAEWCAGRSIVSTFVRFHPLLENRRLAPADAELVRLADAAVWRLEGDDLFAGMHRSHRNKCRKARAAGVEVAVERAPSSLDGFLELHDATMRRQGASDFHRFDRAYWETLAAGLGDGLVRLDAALDGELVASEICVGGGGWLHYHMGVTSDRGRAVGAANLLVYEAAEWGRANGFAELNLGSGLGGREDSLWEFKQRFAPDGGREFWIGKLVNDGDAYRRLAGDAAGDGFFPAYRAGASASSA